MSLLISLLRLFIFAAVILCWSSGISAGQDCFTAKDWKDIYILPTNPNPQNNIRIQLSADKKKAKPGDELNLSFVADGECFLTLMDLGTSGRIVRLWPNDYSAKDNRILPDSPRNFPGPGDNFKFRIGGPDGVERIIAYATTERGKILSEQEFQQIQNTGFQQYVGGAKDLALNFQKATDSLGSNSRWGTAQLNICIGTGSQPETDGFVGSKFHFLGIGADTGGLKFCARDAQKMADTIKSKMNLQESNVRLLLGADATYQQLLASIDWLSKSAQPEDTVIIYYSGHGGSIRDRHPIDEDDGKDEFFVLYPGSQKGMSAVEMLKQKIFLIDDEVNLLLKRIPARRKIVIADSCHSGTISKELGMEVDGLMSKYLPVIDPETGAEDWNLGKKATPSNYGNDHEGLVSACLDNESSYESKDFQGGVFTTFLIQAINQNSVNLEQAFYRAKENVARWVRERSKPNKPISQTPCLTDPHGFAKSFRFQKEF